MTTPTVTELPGPIGSTTRNSCISAELIGLLADGLVLQIKHT